MRIGLISVIGAAGMLSIAAIFGGGCAAHNSAATTRPDSSIAEKSGAQLWTDNCRRCHNLRGPETYSATQWELAMHHMRLRANLTGQETRKITEFLKSAS